jgi:cytochrome c556
MRIIIKASVAALFGASLLAGTVAAQDAQKVIGYRQGVMKAVGWHIGPIAGMAKGEVPFDQAQLQHHADALAALAKMAPEAFAPGSTGMDGTKAKADAVNTNADLVAKSQAFIDASAALSAGAAGVTDAAGIGALLGPVGDACKGCHDTYRAK